VPVTRAALPHPTEPEPVYKTEDAWRVWKACQRVTADEEVSAYLHGRDIDPDETDRLDLARALPRDYRATYTIHAPDGVPRTWAETGYRLIVPMYDHRGEFRSVLAHDLTRSRPARKSTTRGERKGLVMANPIGWILLAQGRAPIGRGDTPQVVWVAEGETDFLSTACGPDRDSTWGGPTAPAVIGVVAGSWTAELAARIPDGSYVLVGTDHNPAGDRYAQSIADTLCHRCNVRRVRIS
jgi:cell wall assembly regulator SMI1